MKGCTLHLGDAMEVLRTLEPGSVDAVVTDPPAGIAFMGAHWDSFGGRCNGNARRDRDAAHRGPGKGAQPFSYSGSALPQKGQRAAFVAFLTPIMAECLRVAKPGAVALVWAIPRTSHWTATALEDAGWEIEDRISHLFGTGFPKHKSKLKPTCEDWWLCRKPGPKWLGVEEGRIEGIPPSVPQPASRASGRWPANVCLDEEAARLLDEQAGQQKSVGTPHRRPPATAKTKNTYGTFNGEENPNGIGAGAGLVSRFFYVAKASRKDRGEGNTHPTVKSQALMRWLVRLACPPGGIVLDPFAGSGSTLLAALTEGRSAVGIERDPTYHTIASARLNAALPQERAAS